MFTGACGPPESKPRFGAALERSAHDCPINYLENGPYASLIITFCSELNFDFLPFLLQHSYVRT